MSFHTKAELLTAGFSSVGENVRISDKVSLYAISGTIGNCVRIDDFCVLKGRLEIGSFVHIAAFCLISGVRGVVRFADCTTLSSGVHVYTGSDDYSADALSSSVVPREHVKTIAGDVDLAVGALVGAHSLLLPGTRIGEGASIGAQCIVYGEIPRGAVLVNRAAKGQIIRYRDWKKIVRLAERLKKSPRVAAGGASFSK